MGSLLIQLCKGTASDGFFQFLYRDVDVFFACPPVDEGRPEAVGTFIDGGSEEEFSACVEVGEDGIELGVIAPAAIVGAGVGGIAGCGMVLIGQTKAHDVETGGGYQLEWRLSFQPVAEEAGEGHGVVYDRLKAFTAIGYQGQQGRQGPQAAGIDFWKMEPSKP